MRENKAYSVELRKSEWFNPVQPPSPLRPSIKLKLDSLIRA